MPGRHGPSKQNSGTTRIGDCRSATFRLLHTSGDARDPPFAPETAEDRRGDDLRAFSSDAAHRSRLPALQPAKPEAALSRRDVAKIATNRLELCAPGTVHTICLYSRCRFVKRGVPERSA